MSWTTLDLNNLLSGEPWIESEAIAVYENPIAIAEGSPDAPRNAARSIKSERLPLVSGTGLTASGWLSLDPLSVIELFVSKRNNSGSAITQMRASNDNGSSYGSWLTVGSGAVSGDALMDHCFFNLETGIIETVQGGGGATLFLTTDLGRVNVNAFQIRGQLTDVNYAAHGRAIMRSNGD